MRSTLRWSWMVSGGNLLFLYVTSGMSSCIGLVLVLYNVVALVMFMREESEGSSSAMAKAAWALGFLSLPMIGVPCVGLVLAVIALVLSRIERGRIYRDESSLAGATPTRMGSVNAGVALLLWVILTGGLVASFVIPAADAGV